MLKNKCLLLICFLFFCVGQFGFSQTFVKGLVLTEDNVPMENVLIYNIKTDKKTSTNSEGFFTIEANINDELRFVKDGYERISVKIVNF